MGFLRELRAVSQQGAMSDLDGVNTRLQRLRQFPKSAPTDDSVEDLPVGTRARQAFARRFRIRYLYPFSVGRRPGLLVVSIRPAEMQPDDIAFHQRLLREYVREVGHLPEIPDG